MVLIHNATAERGIIGLTLPSKAEGGSQGPRGCVEPIITSEVWCYDIILQQSQRESKRERKKERERERERETFVLPLTLAFKKL
jgi:hypothetical protein